MPRAGVAICTLESGHSDDGDAAHAVDRADQGKPDVVEIGRCVHSGRRIRAGRPTSTTSGKRLPMPRSGPLQRARSAEHMRLCAKVLKMEKATDVASEISIARPSYAIVTLHAGNWDERSAIEHMRISQAQWLNVHVDFPLLQRIALPITSVRDPRTASRCCSGLLDLSKRTGSLRRRRCPPGASLRCGSSVPPPGDTPERGHCDRHGVG
jgi:hypothetical protein